MNNQLHIIRQTRINFLKLVDSLSIDELNEVPAGFNNNIAWNLGHIIVSQQVLCYKRANVTPRLDESYFLKYQKGTKPEHFIGEEELSFLKQQLFSLIDELEKDLNADLFADYSPVTTSFGVLLTDVHDAVDYFSSHDTLHLGYSLALRRLIQPTKTEQSTSLQGDRINN